MQYGLLIKGQKKYISFTFKAYHGFRLNRGKSSQIFTLGILLTPFEARQIFCTS